MSLGAPRRYLAGLASAAVAATLLVPIAAHARSSTVPVPAGASSLTVSGQGHGHGHGMSQYGAKVAAERGLGREAILKFYYPGTRQGSAGGTIRVLLSTRKVLTVRNQRALRLTVVGGRTHKLAHVKPAKARRATSWRAVPVGTRTKVQWKRAGGWRTWKTVRNDVEFSAGRQPVRLKAGRDSGSFRGALRSARPHASSTDRDLVNRVPLEQYVRGVVALEMPASWAPHAVQAQAVAARSYAAHERATTHRGHFDVYDTVQSQVYGGVGAETTPSDAAVRATRGQIRTYRGAPAFTQFSASNGGWMLANSSVDYLRSGRDPYDPVRPWTVSIPMSAVAARFGSTYPLAEVTVNSHPAAGGWVDTVTLTGTNGRSNTLSGEAFRAWAGLKSAHFRITG